MSWTSPLTVASTMLPRWRVSVRSMNCSRWPTAAFMASADWSTSATMSWLSLKRRPTSSMPFISGPLMMSSGAASAALGLEVFHQPVARALHDVAGQALVQRQRGPGHPGLLLLAAEVGGEGGHRVGARIQMRSSASRRSSSGMEA